MFKRYFSMLTSMLLLATGMSLLSSQTANAVSITDGSTVSLIAMSSSMAGGGSCSTRQVISTATRVRTLPDGENGEFDSATTNTFSWNSTHQSAFDLILARSSTTRTTFYPTNGTSYTFYQLKEGSTGGYFYFCHAGQMDLLINGTDSITGWAVSGNIFFTAGESSGSAPQQSSQQSAAAAAAETAALLAASIAKAKVVLSTQFSSNKPATLQQFLDANFGVRNVNVAEKVSAAILKLPIADRENSEKINQIINLENFIDRVAVSGTRSTVNSGELVSRGLLPADSVYKYSVVQGLASYPDGSLNSLEKIEAAIKEQIIKAGARKSKTAEIKSKIAARKK